MVRHQVLRALGDPAQVAHARLAGLGQRRSEHQPRWIRQRPSALGCLLREICREPSAPQLLRLGEIEAQQLTPINDGLNLTHVISLDRIRGATLCRVPGLLLLALCALLLGGCGGGDQDEGRPDSARTVEDAGPVHVHGLGINPRDESLLIATHTGIFKAGAGDTEARRVGENLQDTMGFTVVGPDRFLGSGHPDVRDELPAFLGLIRSDDAGRTWEPVSLLGQRDFHVLEAAGSRVYGYGSDFETREQGFLVSEDGGKRWKERQVPEPLISLTIDPADPERLVASGERAVFQSEDAGRTWLPVDAPAGLLVKNDGLVIVDGNGVVHAARDVGLRTYPVGDIDGQPAALEGGLNAELYVALHDGTVKRSADGGRTWTVRSKP